MNIAVSTAIIGAASGLIGASIPQVANWILTSQNYKRELKKEFQIKKTSAYGLLFTAISELLYDLDTAKQRNLEIESLLMNHVSIISDLLLREGIWLDDEEISITKDIRKDLGAIIIDEIEQKRNLPLSKFNSNLIENIELLSKICRSKAREAHYQK
ncbi:hypothetical protein M0L17_11950 [Bacillaceae bacterium OS4b]|nr:hypothetical protein [Bacillaceae bacterium OS4b]